MARTPSTMLELGTHAPDFSLPDPVNNTQVSLADFSGNPLLMIFTCNHCPFVLHIIQSLTETIHSYAEKGIKTVMINANDVANYPDDSPEKMIEFAAQQGFQFPYLFDETQQTAIDYQAACTPDLFLFDGAHKLVYRGEYDDARPGNDQPINGSELKAALDALLAGEAISAEQKPSLGCNIKWISGNEPEYFAH